jgi:hypothetical protein
VVLKFKKWMEGKNIAGKLANDLGIYRRDYGKGKEEIGRFISDIYHMDDFGDKNDEIWVWWWDGNQLYSSKGGTHGSKFGHAAIGAHFKGRYSEYIQTATIAIPHAPGLRAMSEDEFIKLFPEEGMALVDALYRRFPKLGRIVGIG